VFDVRSPARAALTNCAKLPRVGARTYRRIWSQPFAVGGWGQTAATSWMRSRVQRGDRLISNSRPYIQSAESPLVRARRSFAFDIPRPASRACATCQPFIKGLITAVLLVRYWAKADFGWRAQSPLGALHRSAATIHSTLLRTGANSRAVESSGRVWRRMPGQPA
jgi:hypothetical protein